MSNSMIWGIYLTVSEMDKTAKELGVELEWGVPIRPGDLYLAKRNTGPHLLECKALGEGCVFPTGYEYAFDFSECVKVRERRT